MTAEAALAIAPSLAEESQTVFDLNASNYLNDDIHWGDDSDLLCADAARLADRLGRPLDLFYAGVGPGRILIRLLSRYRLFRKITGIDYSERMLVLANARLNQLDLQEGDRIKGVELRLGDVLRPAEGSALFDVAMLVNNTLGNVVLNDSGQQGRIATLENLRRALRPRGILFVTVYDFTNRRLLGDSYTAKLRVLAGHHEQDLLLELSSSGARHLLYSHWFTQKEICELLRYAKFIVRDVTTRSDRIIVTAEKR